jgi:ribose transport system substrate-binding protein
MKKILSLIAAVLMLASLCACGSTAAPGGSASAAASASAGGAGAMEGKSVSVMTPYLSAVTTNQMVQDLQSGLEAEGAEVTVIDTANDFSELADRIEDVVSAGTDAIVLVSADPTQLKNQLQDAFDAGIPVFGCDSGYLDGMQVNATSDNYQMGKMMVSYLFDDLMGGKGTVVALTYRPHPGVAKRCEAFDDLLASHDGISLVTEQLVPADQPINNAQNIVQNLLVANPEKGSITAIWCGWDEPAIGATQACQEAGRDEILIVGADGNDQALSLIKAGTNLKATVAQNFEGMADIVVEQMTKLFSGEAIQKGDMYAEAKLITTENAG